MIIVLDLIIILTEHLRIVNFRAKAHSIEHFATCYLLQITLLVLVSFLVLK